MELADYLSVDDARQLASQTVEQPSFRQLGTDARFEALIGTLRAAASQTQETEQITNARGQPVVKVARLSQGLRLCIDERFAPGFSGYLIRLLPELIRSFDQGSDRQSKTD
jgi:hypothetical protein